MDQAASESGVWLGRPEVARRLATNFSIDSIIGNIIIGNRTTGAPPTEAQAIDLSRPPAHPEEAIVDVVSVSEQQQPHQWLATSFPHKTTFNHTPLADTLAGSQPEAGQPNGEQANGRKLRAKKYQCPYCWVALSNTGQFRGHIRIHTGERPFKCDQPACQKTFTRNEELTRHKRIHTGQRPYACHLCNKRFGRKDHLKKHTRTHEKNALKIMHHQHQTPTRQLINNTPPAGPGSGNLQLWTFLAHPHPHSHRSSSSSSSSCQTIKNY